MATWTKHRRTEIDRTVDFSGVLNDGETIASITEVVVTDKDGTDVSAEFGSPTGTIDGTDVNVTLGAAQSDTDQTKDIYKVLVEILTSDNEPKASTDDDGKVATLHVSDHGDPA